MRSGSSGSPFLRTIYTVSYANSISSGLKAAKSACSLTSKAPPLLGCTSGAYASPRRTESVASRMKT